VKRGFGEVIKVFRGSTAEKWTSDQGGRDSVSRAAGCPDNELRASSRQGCEMD